MTGLSSGLPYFVAPPDDSGGGVARAEALENGYRNFRRNFRSVEKIPLEQIRSGADIFYRDFRNQNFNITFTIDFVIDQINGNDRTQYLDLYRRSLTR